MSDWTWEQIVINILEPLDGHNLVNMEKVVERLKQSDGEGWAAGEMLERVLKLAENNNERIFVDG